MPHDEKSRAHKYQRLLCRHFTISKLYEFDDLRNTPIFCFREKAQVEYKTANYFRMKMSASAWTCAFPLRTVLMFEM